LNERPAMLDVVPIGEEEGSPYTALLRVEVV
jgi:hypothetical protein